MNFILKPGELSLTDIEKILAQKTTLQLHPQCHHQIHASTRTVAQVIEQKRTVYGINTGFGSLAHTRIKDEELALLQEKIVLSHAAGTGDFFNDETVKLILLLKINSLARGYSGIRLAVIEGLIAFFNHEIYPCIPSQGSVGASGDLAPLAHLSCALLGVGDVRCHGEVISAMTALQTLQLSPYILGPKEGLALLNGTQVSTALALQGLIRTRKIFSAALLCGALSVDATLGSVVPFDARIHAVRGSKTQSQVAAHLQKLLAGSEIGASHPSCEKVQDPYSLRCQPQVMGAALAQINFVTDTLMTEANAVSDNPLVFADDAEILSGGNFHAEPVAMAADNLALAIAEIGSLSERRIALLTDARFSGLPPFLVDNPGINSGFMLAHVTAAALVSENKLLAHPACVDSIPTSANQEDHVSMATHGARRLLQMCENTCAIVAIELLAAAQGIDFRKPLKTSAHLAAAHTYVRATIPFYAADRYFAKDIALAKTLIFSAEFAAFLT